MKFARIENNVAVDVSPSPAAHFHPDVASEFDPVPDEVEVGWVNDGSGNWSAPAPPPETPPAPRRPIVTIVEFKLLWRPEERIALKAMAQTDPVIEDFWSLVHDPKVTIVDLSMASIISAITFTVQALVDNGTIASGDQATRLEEILSGSVT